MSNPWLGNSAAPKPLAASPQLEQSLGYRLKVALLGQPLTRSDLQHEKLSKRIALGVLSSDCISSSAYGSEEMLIVLLPAFGVAGFAILMPLTFVVLAVLTVVTLSYREVVMVYTKSGGSYVVARENFGPTVAQVAAVALMLDYIVTVAVQSAAGTAALTSAIPALAHGDVPLFITLAVVLLLCFGNLRGLREAGRTFAFPTYFFAIALLVVILVGVVREVFGDLPHYPLGAPGTYPIGHGEALLAYGAIFILLRAFANGGSSLTGLEAISNGVGVFKAPAGSNARRTLVVMSVILGTLVLGVSWLAHETHAQPYLIGSPTVISQVTQTVFGHSLFGHSLFLVVQLATMLILWTGANTPFNGFPFLTSFVAEDQFLPRQLMRRGHRLAFSNGIIVLTVLSSLLLIATKAHVNDLVAFYAIGVFTGFTFAGFGMAKHFHAQRIGRWRAKVIINTVSGSVSALVVLIFAVVKFTEGAWLVVLIFPIGVLALIRLNRQYRREAEVLSHLSPATTTATGRITSSKVFLLVDEVDLATIGAVRYGRSLRPSEMRAVHFVIDTQRADEIRDAWADQPALREVPLQFIDCPDRRLSRAALEFAASECASGRTELTLLLPRRTYSPFLGRLLHDRTADSIAGAVSRMQNVVATIVPFDVDAALDARFSRTSQKAGGPLHDDKDSGEIKFAEDEESTNAPAKVRSDTALITRIDEVDRSANHWPPTRRCSELAWRTRSTIQGEVRSIRVASMATAPTLEVEVWDGTGGITLLFYGRRAIGGISPGVTLRATGMVGDQRGTLAISNPLYEIVAPSPNTR